MVFFVVVPIVFGFFANFFIPYHIGSKDVAFPRLNNIGFWLFPAGYILVAKPAFLRPSIVKYFDKPSFYYNLLSKNSTQDHYLQNSMTKTAFNLGSSRKKTLVALDEGANPLPVFPKTNYLGAPLNFFKSTLLSQNFGSL